MVAVESRGAVSCHESKQFFLLCADSHPCAARARGAGRADLCHSQAEEVGPPAEPVSCDRALLAFYGNSLAVPAFAALDETLTDSIRRRREPSGFDHGRTLVGHGDRAGIF